jgi:hypothetical protein
MNGDMDKRENAQTIHELTPQQMVRMVQLLNDSANNLDDSTLLRLAESRKQAVAVLENKTGAGASRSVTLEWRRRFDSFRHSEYRIWAPALLLLAILVGAFGPSFLGNNAPINTDSLVLASDLPPETFADKEFVAWLDHTSRL